MSKVDELRLKYPTIATVTFNKFVEADKTPTKKYTEFLLKSWSNRGLNDCPSTTSALIELVKKFDELLPYIANKDIYMKEYYAISYLKLVIARAEEIKEERTFVRDEHVFVLEETDDYLLLQPLTHRGSLKYGAQTKWCTASRNDTHSFNRYTKGGLLVYLLDKTGKKHSNYNKIAFHLSYSHDVYTDGFEIFATNDNQVNSDTVLNGGWSEDVLLRVSTMYNILFRREKKLKKSKDYIQSFSDTLNKLNFESLQAHLNILEQEKNIDYTCNIQEQINKLAKNLNNINHATRLKT